MMVSFVSNSAYFFFWLLWLLMHATCTSSIFTYHFPCLYYFGARLALGGNENLVFIFGVDVGSGNNESLQYFQQPSSSIINNNNDTNIDGGSKGDNEEEKENYKI
jgi:hypothetical protein